MKLGIHLLNRGPNAKRALILESAQIADTLPVDELWVFDHLAIPREQSEGSQGFYIEPLATLAYVAGATARVGIGTRVLILPYRPPLLTAKWVAAIQELSGGRLILGVGVGWLDAEFRALGVAKARRGALTDETLDVINRCFAEDEVEVNGQRFLFRPRPQRPPILVGGSPPQALARAVRYGDGWMVPRGDDAAALREPIATLRRMMREAGKPAPEISVSGTLPLDDREAARAKLTALADAGVTRFALNQAYASGAEFRRMAEQLLAAAGRT
jgi:probable F420-dependent oxidoreductase